MPQSPLLFSLSFLVTLLSLARDAKATDLTAENIVDKDDRLALNFTLPPVSHKHGKDPYLEAVSLRESPASLDFVDASAEQHREIERDRTLQKLETLSRPAETLRDIAEQPMPSLTVSDRSIGIHFAKDTLEQALSEQAPLGQTAQTLSARSPAAAYGALGLDDWIFTDGSESLVAHAVGNAEGTRHWNGDRTRAYYGHTDPGNGAWNIGTFSYQHAADSPEEADRKQLARLKSQAIQLEQQAVQRGLQLSLLEKLNGLDLANQAPVAALGQGGYIDRLAQAQRLQLSGEEAIAWARTRAYIDPETKKWNAPGLGNTLRSISQDQERRMTAIDRALRAYDQFAYADLELAQLEDIQIEDVQIENIQLDISEKAIGLDNPALAEDVSADGLLEYPPLEIDPAAFKLAAHDIFLAEDGLETLEAHTLAPDVPEM